MEKPRRPVRHGGSPAQHAVSLHQLEPGPPRHRRSRAAQRRPARRSVLFFGDSYVQGYGLSNQQTFAWMVQKTHPELAISNFGTADYGTYQSYLAHREIRPRPLLGLLSLQQLSRGAERRGAGLGSDRETTSAGFVFPLRGPGGRKAAAARVAGRNGVAGQPLAAHRRAGPGLLSAHRVLPAHAATSAPLPKRCS